MKCFVCIVRCGIAKRLGNYILYNEMPRKAESRKDQLQVMKDGRNESKVYSPCCSSHVASTHCGGMCGAVDSLGGTEGHRSKRRAAFRFE